MPRTRARASRGLNWNNVFSRLLRLMPSGGLWPGRLCKYNISNNSAALFSYTFVCSISVYASNIDYAFQTRKKIFPIHRDSFIIYLSLEVWHSYSIKEYITVLLQAPTSSFEKFYRCIVNRRRAVVAGTCGCIKFHNRSTSSSLPAADSSADFIRPPFANSEPLP